MNDRLSYPELVDVIKHLQRYGHSDQARICVEALYHLNCKDKRILELQKEIDVWKFEAIENFKCAQERAKDND